MKTILAITTFVAVAVVGLGAVYCVPASVCGQRVTGVFDAGDPGQALREIEAYLGLKALRLTDYMIILHE